MDFKHALQKLEQTKDFKEWKKSNNHIYFSHAFKIPQEMKSDEWHLGFYNKKNDKGNNNFIHDAADEIQTYIK